MNAFFTRPAQRRAFSFVEIAIAILILALGVIPLIGVFISNSEETRANKNRSIAAALASQVLERYRRFRPKQLEGKFADAMDPGRIAQIETSKALPTASKEITDDPLLSPKAGDLKDEYVKDFYGRVASMGFVRVASFKTLSVRSGALTCTVFWKERAAGVDRVLSYSLATMLTDPIFPMGREEPGNN